MKSLEKRLNYIDIEKAEVDYTKLTGICTEQNHFSLNNKLYKQESGLATSNPLSLFLENLFMRFFET